MANEGEGAVVPVVAAVPAAVVVPPVVPATAVDMAPPWLPDRLKRAEDAAQAKLLSDLGITDPAKAKELISAANKAAEDAKTAAEKLGETSATLKSAQGELERQKSITTEWAARMMIGLTAEQQAAVKAIAGEDSATQLRTIQALTPTWASAAVAPPAAVPAAKAAVTPASGTAPPAGAPPPATGTIPDHAAIHAELQKTNPFAAASYGLQHAAEVFKTPS